MSINKFDNGLLSDKKYKTTNILFKSLIIIYCLFCKLFKLPFPNITLLGI